MAVSRFLVVLLRFLIFLGTKQAHFNDKSGDNIDVKIHESYCAGALRCHRVKLGQRQKRGFVVLQIISARKETFRNCPQVPQKVPFIADKWIPSNRHSVRYEGMDRRDEVADMGGFLGFFSTTSTLRSSAFEIALDSGHRSIFPLLPT